ncbi:hypothetical protein DDZ14_02185 [Maritimibacter sp. 55A14]|uniref:DUF6778 family protein n=1 Tax=Maritimibacter sp. 55A14 TaxID=2174844 RepID=UPI000D6156C8|nr:DUF6778 family protein [Maritimibacter sp. 55A14]PWE33992.1 hypothetical protein DDZ14_02185 [Maritimibacter sp. 55A14]
MGIWKNAIALGLAAALGACASTDTVSRDTPAKAPVLNSQSAMWRVQDVRVTVPKTLSVSEANLFYPLADIVWRGEPRGDRYAQVAAIIDAAVTDGTAHLRGSQPVFVDVEVERFHSVTEKTRYSVGGTHSIRFRMRVVDAVTGAVLNGPTLIKTELEAYGGKRAIEAEQSGETQKRRVTRHVAAVMQQKFGHAGARGAMPRPAEAE